MDEQHPSELSSTEIIRELRMKAFFWRQEAERFAGRPEEQICLEHALHAETLAAGFLLISGQPLGIGPQTVLSKH
ncbi:hypothetical protein Q2941_43430 [Bradyrhizobium sp. UFLA05-153]